MWSAYAVRSVLFSLMAARREVAMLRSLERNVYLMNHIPQYGKDKLKDKINYLSKHVMVLYEIVELIKMFSLYDKTRRVAYVLYLISFIMCIKRVYTVVKSWKIYSHTFASHSTLIMNPCVQCYINNLRYKPICECIMVLGWKFLKVASGMNTFLTTQAQRTLPVCIVAV